MSTDPARNLFSPRVVAIGLLAVSLTVSACGRRGALEAPPDADPQDVRAPTETPVPPPEGTRPDRPFILDGLLL